MEDFHWACRVTSVFSIVMALPAALGVPVPFFSVFHPVNSYPGRVNMFWSTMASPPVM